MDNSNSNEAKNDVNEESPKASKRTFFQKLKSKRWTFKVKNNLTEYLSVEPLICFYMLQIFVVSSTLPYYVHKACVSLDEDTYFCDVITYNQNSIYQKCATIYDHLDFFCKGLAEGISHINCDAIIDTYERNETKVYVRPEDFRLCKVIDKTVLKVVKDTDSLVDISAMIITFLVVMIVSIWSDKYSKRKMCLMLPLLGVLLTSIINLYGALSTSLSFDINNTATQFIGAISGGMTLFLFGCFSYMNNETIKRKLLFRFGIICFILTIYRFIPPLYDNVYQYFYDDDAYITLISITLVLNIICILYVKVILNESKEDVIVNSLDNGSQCMKEEVECISTGKSSTSPKYTKRKQLAKAFNLDVIWDYILIVFKKRIQSGRLVIIIFLAVVLVDKISPYDARLKLILDDNKEIDIIDIDAGIFVIISITMFVFKISDVFIAILVIGIPIIARIVMALLAILVLKIENDDSGTDFYTPFKRIAACSLLLRYVDKNESRIFLIVQALAYLPKLVFKLVTSEENATLLDVFNLDDRDEGVILLIVLLLVFCGLGLLYKFARKYENIKTELISPKKTIETITENLHKPDDFGYRNGDDNNQLDTSN